MSRVDHDALVSLYDRLASVNLDAFEAGYFEVAYHALMGALHTAEDLNDEDRLRALSRLAAEQQAGIDAKVPDHRLATAPAAKRGHETIFAMASRQASARAIMARRDKQRRVEAGGSASA